MHGVSDTCGAYYWSPGLERPAPGPSRAERPRGESDSERQLERRERIRHNVFMYEVWRVRERACVEFCTFVWLSFLRIEPRPTDARVSTVVASRLDRACLQLRHRGMQYDYEDQDDTRSCLEQSTATDLANHST